MRKLFKHIGMICLALAVAVGSFFVPIQKPNYSQMASAVVALPGVSPIPSPDSDFTQILGSQFTGSDVFVVNFTCMSNDTLITDFSLYPTNGVYSKDYNYFQYQFGFTIAEDSFLLRYKGVRAYSTNSFIRSPGSTGSLSDSSRQFQNTIINDFGISDLRDSFVADSYVNIETVSPMQIVYSQSSIVGYVNFGIQIFKNNSGVNDFVPPTLDMNYVLLLNYTQVNSVLGIPYSGNFDSSNVICYVDSAGYYYLIYIPSDNLYTENSSNYFFNYRRYILKEPNFTQEQLYQQGYQAGLSDNQSSIYNSGYNTGFDDGFSNGKSEGIAVANDYSFISLFGALFDAPVTMLMGLLNFEFLGINLWAFVTSLFTLALVLFIVKLIMGR